VILNAYAVGLLSLRPNLANHHLPARFLPAKKYCTLRCIASPSLYFAHMCCIFVGLNVGISRGGVDLGRESPPGHEP